MLLELRSWCMKPQMKTNHTCAQKRISSFGSLFIADSILKAAIVTVVKRKGCRIEKWTCCRTAIAQLLTQLRQWFLYWHAFQILRSACKPIHTHRYYTPMHCTRLNLVWNLVWIHEYAWRFIVMFSPTFTVVSEASGIFVTPGPYHTPSNVSPCQSTDSHKQQPKSLVHMFLLSTDVYYNWLQLS